MLVSKMSPLHRAGVAEWQTRGIQNPVSFTGCVGSTPTFGTLLKRDHRLANVLRTPALPGFSHFRRRMFGSASRIRRIRSRCQGFSPVLRFLGQVWASGWAREIIRAGCLHRLTLLMRRSRRGKVSREGAETRRRIESGWQFPSRLRVSLC